MASPWTFTFDNFILKHLAKNKGVEEVAYHSTNTVGDKRYELANHLGNVLEVVSDRKLPVSDLASVPKVASYTADVMSFSDYYPFGQVMPNRHGADNTYRYGFQGQERDDEIKGDGNSVNFEYRMHDSRLGRFFSIDPLIKRYPFYSSYQFSGNKVTNSIELEGREPGLPVVYQSLEAKKGNVIIYLVDSEKDFDMSVFDDDDTWNVIAVTDLTHAKDVLNIVYGKGEEIHNIVIRTHGDPNAGTLYLTNSTQGDGNNLVQGTFLDEKILENPQTDFDKKQVTALKGIFSHVGDGGNIIMMACGLGTSNVPEKLLDLANSSSGSDNIKIYANKDLTTSTIQYENEQNFNFDANLTTPEDYKSGWIKVGTNNQGGIYRSDVTNKVPEINDDVPGIIWNQAEKTSGEANTTDKGSKAVKK